MKRSASIRRRLTTLTFLLLAPAALLAALWASSQRTEMLRVEQAHQGLARTAALWPAYASLATYGAVSQDAHAALSSNKDAEPLLDPLLAVEPRLADASALFERIGRESGLARLTEERQAFIAELVIDRLPAVILGARGVAREARRIKIKSEFNPYDRMSFLVTAGQYKQIADTLSAAAAAKLADPSASAADAVASAGARMAKANAALQQQAALMAVAVNTSTDVSSFDIAPFEAAYSDMIEASAQLWDAAATSLATKLQARAERLSYMAAGGMAGAFGAIAALLALFFLHASARRRETELAQWRDLSEAAQDGLAICDGQRIVASNEKFAELAGTAAGALVGVDIGELLDEPDLAARLADEDTAFEASLRCGADETAPVEITTHSISYLGKLHRVLTLRDLRERKEAQESIHFLAHHDSLTKLANRLRLREELEAALRRCKRGETFAVLCLDLDHFKQANDTLGHAVGDQLLCAVADRLRVCVREGDVVARAGGDEFAIVASDQNAPVGATRLAERIVEDLSQPYEIGDHQVVIGASVGIAFAPGDGDDCDTLLKNADLALYRAKHDGRGVYRIFEPAMDALMQQRRRLELDLRQALTLGQFELHYQTVVDAQSQRITAFEALLRWRHPERGLVSPGEFIPLAEECGLMGAIGDWVLKRACLEAKQWPDDIRVAVNVSPVQFRACALEPSVFDALGESGLPAHRLEVEITESVLLERTEETLSTLHRLNEAGVRISLDDFGTGYSSLSYLNRFPFDKIKIDQSFTKFANSEASAMAIIRAVIGLGNSLGMATIAEGVETLEQFESLKNEGCGALQGYLFSRPMPADQIARHLAEHALGGDSYQTEYGEVFEVADEVA